MGEKLLSDRACRAATPREKAYYKSDGKGLRLLVHPNGSRYWILRFRLNGKPSNHGLGTYPDVSLEEARTRAKKARDAIRDGHHPTAARRAEKHARHERTKATFKTIAEEWLKRNKAEWSGHHYERNEGLLRRLLYEDLGDTPIADITAPMLLKVLVKYYDAGIKESARRARTVAAGVFTHAQDTGRCEMNPAVEIARSSLLKKPEVEHHAALPVEDVGRFLTTLEKSPLEPVTTAALYLAFCTGLRDAALRAGQWKEIDVKAKTWTVPKERMKSGRVFVTPLPEKAIAVLKELAKLTKKNDESFIFASHGKDGFLAENTLRLALHRIGHKGVTVHGFRSLMTTVCNEKGWNADAIERQMDHMEKNAVRAAYLRGDFMDVRREMIEWYAAWGDAMVREFLQQGRDE